jgi:hypothetical protein
MPSDSSPPIAGDLYGELIREHFEHQADRKTSLEQRGLAVISTSAALVTLQFALVALVVDRQTLALSGLERAALGASLALFVSAAVLGLLTNMTRSYTYVSTRQLDNLTKKDRWEASPVQARRRIARARVRMLRAARARNRTKAKLLRYAIVSEVAAVAALAICIALIMI